MIQAALSQIHTAKPRQLNQERNTYSVLPLNALEGTFLDQVSLLLFDQRLAGGRCGHVLLLQRGCHLLPQAPRFELLLFGDRLHLLPDDRHFFRVHEHLRLAARVLGVHHAVPFATQRQNRLLVRVEDLAGNAILFATVERL